MISSHAVTMRRQEDQRLLRLYHGAGDVGAREELVHRFLPLARQLARRYQRRGEPIDDLVQVASLGLLKAIDRFDPARQTALSSFAIPTIVGELKRYFRDHGWAVHVPRGLQERIARVEEATEALWREQGRAPTPAEVAERTQHTVEQVLEARQAADARWAISLDRSGDDKDAGAPADSLAIDEPGFLLAEDAATTERLMHLLPAASGRSYVCASARTCTSPRSQSASASRRRTSRACFGGPSKPCTKRPDITPPSRSWPQRTASDT